MPAKKSRGFHRYESDRRNRAGRVRKKTVWLIKKPDMVRAPARLRTRITYASLLGRESLVTPSFFRKPLSLSSLTKRGW